MSQKIKMAYAREFSQIFTEELSCPVCLEELKEPKCLTSCAHNVCRECLERMAIRNRKEISCPTCRRTTVIPEGGIKALPTSTVLVRLLEATPGRRERFDIQKALDSGKPVVELLEKKISKLEKSYNDMKLTVESLEKDIHDKADQICEIVRKQEECLCAEAKEFYKKQDAIIDHQKNNLIKLHSNAASSVQIAEEVLEQSNANELVDLANALVQQLEEVARLNLSEPEINANFQEDLVFYVNEEASAILEERKFGKISRKSLQKEIPSSFDPLSIDWSQSGEVLYKLGHKGSKKSQFKSPAGVAVNEFGEVAVTDFFNNRVQVFNTYLKFIFQFGKKGIEEGQFRGPTGIAYTPYNNIVVFDSKNSRVQIFNRKGEYVNQLGCHGTNTREFGQSGSLSVDTSGDIIVTDTENNRVQVFCNNGEFKLQFGHTGTEGFDQPLATVALENEYFTTDSGNNCIKVFNSEGQYVRQFGREGTGPGEFHCPRGLAIDRTNKLLIVCDSENHDVQIFNLQGNIRLRKFSTKKVPVAVEIMQNKFILICSYLGNCVQLLSYI